MQIENSEFVEACDEQAHTNSGDWSLTSSTLMLTVAELDFPPLSSAVIVWKNKNWDLFFFSSKQWGHSKVRKDSNKWKFSHALKISFDLQLYEPCLGWLKVFGFPIFEFVNFFQKDESRDFLFILFTVTNYYWSTECYWQ